MIEAVRTGKPVSIVEFQELTENDPEFSFQINEVKKEYKRGLPKVYRNETGKRYYLTRAIHEVECDIQVDAENENAIMPSTPEGDEA